MLAKRIFLTLTLAAIVAVSATVAQAQSADTDQSATQPASQGGGVLDVLEQIKQAQAQGLEGSWVVTITPVVPAGVPQPPSFRAYATLARGGAFIGTDTRRLFNIQHGTWAHLITGANEFAGVSNAEERNAAGAITASRCGTIRGERITVGQLAPQCQSITPPQ